MPKDNYEEFFHESTGFMMVNELLHRHRAFWQRAPVERPLVGYMPVKSCVPRPYPLRGGQSAFDPRCITAEDIDIDHLVGFQSPLPSLLTGELLNPLGCVYPEAWMEAFIGCPIWVSAFGCVSRPVTEDIDEALATFSVQEALHSPWLDIAEACVRRAHTRAGDAYPVSQIHTRGVVDMLAAYLGETGLCLALYDAPEKVAALAEQFTTLFQRVVARILPLCGTWQGGGVSEWNVYAPGPCLDYQIDASSLISPDLYTEYLLPFDQKILHAFPYSMLHLHSCGLHLIDPLLRCDAVSAIEISFDREAGRWDRDKLLHTCRSVQQAGKPLLIFSEFSEEEYEDFISALDPAGLAVMYWGRLG